MKIIDVLYESAAGEVRYVNVADADEFEEFEGGLDYYDIMAQAEALIKYSKLRMLRSDNITDVALDGDKVVGVLYSANDGGILRMSIAVHPKYQGSGIATVLFNMLDTDGATKLVAELVPPYTMERFVQSRGFKFKTQERDIKIYEKLVR